VHGQVRARAEGFVPRAGEDGEPHLIVIAEPRPRVEQQVIGLRVDGVALIWPVQRDVGDLAALVTGAAFRNDASRFSSPAVNSQLIGRRSP
jgi:hypothetical protein